MTHPTFTSPTHTGTLKPEGTPPRFYWIVPTINPTPVDSKLKVEQEKEACHSQKCASSSCSPSSPSPPSPSPTDSPVATSDPLRWGCRVVPREDGVDVQWGGYELRNSHRWYRSPISVPSCGCFLTEEIAMNNLNHPDTPPPPGWKEPEAKCPECGVKDGHQSLCNQKPKAEKPASPGLRAAHDVVDDICRRVHFDDSTEGKRKMKALNAERVAVLEWAGSQLGWPHTRVIDRLIRELKGQT